MTVIGERPSDVSGRAVTGAFLWSLSSDVLSKAALLATTFIAMRLLAPLTFAQMIGLQASALLGAVAWDCGVSSLVTREIAAGRTTIGRSLRWSARVRAFTSPVWAAVYVAGWLILEQSGPPPIPAVAWIAASSLFIGLQQVTLGILRGKLQFGTVGMALVLGRWTTLGVALMAFLPYARGRELAVIAMATTLGEAVTLGVSAAAIGRLHRLDGVGVKTARATLALKAAVPFALNGLIQVAYNRFDVLFVAALSTAKVLSAYAATSRIQDAMFILPSAAALIILPLSAKLFAMENGDSRVSRRLWIRTTAGVVLASLLLVVVVSLGGAALIPSVLGNGYADAVSPVQIVVWSVPIVAFNSVLAAVVSGRGMAHYVTVAIFVAFLASLALNVWLVPSMGADGAALAATLRELPVALVLGVAARVSGLFSASTAPRSAASIGLALGGRHE